MTIQNKIEEVQLRLSISLKGTTKSSVNGLGILTLSIIIAPTKVWILYMYAPTVSLADHLSKLT